jgi:hypothetical protein
MAELQRGFATLLRRPGWGNGGDAETVYDKMCDARANRVYELAATGERETPAALLHSDAEHAINELLKHRPEGAPRQCDPNVVVVELPCEIAADRTQQFQFQRENVRAQTASGSGEESENRFEDVTEEDENNNRMAKEQEEWELLGEREQEQIREEADAREREAEELAENERRAAEEKLRMLEEELARAREEAERKRLEKEAAAAREAARLAKKEAQVQRDLQKLRRLGPCPAGFAWSKQGSEYICGGGSHKCNERDIDRYCQ